MEQACLSPMPGPLFSNLQVQLACIYAVFIWHLSIRGLPCRILYPWAFVGLLCLVGIAHMQLEHLGSSSHTNMASVMTNGGVSPVSGRLSAPLSIVILRLQSGSCCSLCTKPCAGWLHADARCVLGYTQCSDWQQGCGAELLVLMRTKSVRLSSAAPPPAVQSELQS